MAGSKKIKTLILTESAGKAKTLRKFLGRQYLVMSTEGFLRDLPRSRIGIDAEQNYAPDYITVRGKGPLLKEIKNEAMEARRVFMAMNPDGTGEFLSKQCCEIFGVNPKSRCRIFFDELTKTAVKDAVENIRAIDEKLIAAFQTRQIIDKFVSHQVGEYLACKIYRGVKVGRFRAMLLKIIAGSQPDGKFQLSKKFTPAVLQELAAKELNFSAPKTRLLTEQLYEGMNFEKEGCGGLIKYPHGGEIQLTSDHRPPETVKEFLTDSQFKLYSLIHEKILAGGVSAEMELDGAACDLSVMAALDTLKVDWAEFYSRGVSSLVKRKYIAVEDSKFQVTELGKKVLSALDGFFDEVFSVDTYNKIAAQIHEVAEGKAEKISVIENYCAEFGKCFDAAMAELGEDAKPQDEPVLESGEVCEKCGRPMLIRRGRYGQFLACSGYPECKNAKPYVDYLEQKCPKCGGRLTRRNFGRGRFFYSCENFPTCDFSTWDEPQEKVCRECGATMFVHRFKDRAAMLYCGNENCPTRKDHPVNKIIAEARRRAEARKLRKENKSRKQN